MLEHPHNSLLLCLFLFFFLLENEMVIHKA